MTYWQIAVEEALSEVGADGALSDEQITKFARAMSDAAEMEGEATGRHLIPDPRETEVQRLKAQLEAVEREAALQESALRDALRQACARWEHKLAHDYTGKFRDLNDSSPLR